MTERLFAIEDIPEVPILRAPRRSRGEHDARAKVVLERVYPHEHSEWFRSFVAGYYAKVYLGEDLTRDETMARLDELLGLERAG